MGCAIMRKIYIPKHKILQMVLASLETYPKESFGLLIGDGNVVTDVYIFQSAERQRNLVAFDTRQIEELKQHVSLLYKQKVIGSFHSHTLNSTLAMSDADRQNLSAIGDFVIIIHIPYYESKSRTFKNGVYAMRQRWQVRIGCWQKVGRRWLKVAIKEVRNAR